MNASVLIPLAVLLGFGSVAVAAVAYLRAEKEPEGLRRRFLHRFYAYVMLFIAALLLLFGGGTFVKAVLAYPLGMPFSYRGRLIYEEIRPEEEVRITPPQILDIQYDERQRTRDLSAGAAFAGVGVLAYGLHWALRNRVESVEERRRSFLYSGYLMVSGVLFGGIALVSIPIAIHQTLDYLLNPYSKEDIWMRPVPGEVLGFALLALALWVWIVPPLFRRHEG